MTARPAAGPGDLAVLDRYQERHDGARLRTRLREDGFLLLRGLIPAHEVRRVRSRVLAALGRVGWLAAGSDPEDAVPGPRPHHDRGRRDGEPVRDPEWAVGYRAVQSLEVLHALAHHPELTAVLRRLLGEQPVVHPRKIARISFPGSSFPTPPHQDAVFNKTVDVLTAWVPLGGCPRSLGGLRLLHGSTRLGELAVEAGDGLGGERVRIDEDDPRWLGCDYRAGDVVLFHSWTVHTAPANHGDRLRLSVDFRYQSAREPVKLAALLPHGHSAGTLPGWSELTSGWASTRWVEVGQAVHVATVAPASRPSSVLLA